MADSDLKDLEGTEEVSADNPYITDHGPQASIPNTLDQEAFEEQREDVETVNEGLDITVLQGLEAEVTDSGLGLPEDWPDHCDLIVAGMHSDPVDPTERVFETLRGNRVDILAHPSNRLINERDPFDLDLEMVMETAAEEDVAIEINAQPERLDLEWSAVKQFRDTVSYVISTHAHTTGELDSMHLGVAQARRGLV